jgi:hypothetical protein
MELIDVDAVSRTRRLISTSSNMPNNLCSILNTFVAAVAIMFFEVVESTDELMPFQPRLSW